MLRVPCKDNSELWLRFFSCESATRREYHLAKSGMRFLYKRIHQERLVAADRLMAVSVSTPGCETADREK